jgi:hypothetical protein
MMTLEYLETAWRRRPQNVRRLALWLGLVPYGNDLPLRVFLAMESDR